MRETNEISAYLDNIILLLLGIFAVSFPLIFTTFTTDAFSLPKQMLLAAVTLVSLILFSVKVIAERKVTLRKTPYDGALVLFGVATLLSGVLSVNRPDALIAFVPLFLTLTLYFLIVNVVKKELSILFLLSCLVMGGVLTSIIAIAHFLKLYIFPFPFTATQTFSPFGALLDQALYLLLLLPIAGFFAVPVLKGTRRQQVNVHSVIFVTGFLIMLIGFVITVYAMITIQKPTILPFETGFRTGFAAISQDTGRTLTGFLLGSGIGTYMNDFTRFKAPTFNLNSTLWSLTFIRSSSYVLELMATTGILGLAAFLFLFLKVVRHHHLIATSRHNAAYLALIFGIIAAFLLPFSFIIQTQLFLLLALFVVIQGIREPNKFYEVEVYFVALKHGLISLGENASTHDKAFAKYMPIAFFLITLVLVGALGFFIVGFSASDVLFQNSLVAASKNQGLQTYNDQINAIRIFPYRDAYYRIYSQTNLALANSLAGQQQKGSSPSAQVQQTLYTLIQQSISAARTATGVSPMTALNWQNLSSIYQSLIGFGQNAESFSIASMQQAIVLDPQNPQYYLNLGGIYYQLKQYDDAMRYFQVAANIKPNFANAHYNLGHTLEAKGQLQDALLQYQLVEQLMTNDKTNADKIKNEIAALKVRIGDASNQQQNSQTPLEQGNTGVNSQPPLGINKPTTQLPEQKTPLEIPGPSTSPSPKPSSGPLPTSVQATPSTSVSPTP